MDSVTADIAPLEKFLRDDLKKKNGKISDIVQKGGRGVESISLFLTD